MSLNQLGTFSGRGSLESHFDNIRERHHGLAAIVGHVVIERDRVPAIFIRSQAAITRSSRSTLASTSTTVWLEGSNVMPSLRRSSRGS